MSDAIAPHTEFQRPPNGPPFEKVVNRADETVDTSNYSPDAINALNSLFYSSCPEAFAKEGGLASLYSAEPIVQRAIGGELARQLQGKKDIRIKELSSGSTTDRWANIPTSMPDAQTIHVTLSDFSENGLPDERSLKAVVRTDSRLSFSTEAENFFNPMVDLPSSDRYDAMLATYSFDSVWLPSDSTVQKKDGEWMEQGYHLTVDGKDETSDRLVEGLKLGYSPDGQPFAVEDFDRVSLDTAELPVDMQQIPYGDEVLKRYDKRNSSPPINVPGGLVDKVNEVFVKQLKPDGVIMICDVAINDPRAMAGGFNEKTRMFEDPQIMDVRNTGPVAKYKVMDFGLAVQILQKQGYAVEVKPLAALIGHSGESLPSKLRAQEILIVKKAL